MKDYDYICMHIMNTTHSAIREYQCTPKPVFKTYYGDSQEKDPVLLDKQLEQKLLQLADAKVPIIHAAPYPVHYAILRNRHLLFIIGPVSVENKTCTVSCRKTDESDQKNHEINSYTKISYCKYELFCEEILLLFYLLSGKKMFYQELNKENSKEHHLSEQMGKNISNLVFSYREYTKKHNPYSREMREMESIKNGDVNALNRSIDETFEGEYARLSKNDLQSHKNLAIVGLAISARAAINGGMHYEEAFSINDGYILQVDECDSIAKIEGLVRQAKIQYATMIHQYNEPKEKNKLIEACKTLIFQNLHSKIVIGDLAKELNITSEYLSGLFKKTEGICISDYIMQKKITASENLLKYSPYTIEQIALYLGFCSLSHFGKVFKKIRKMTPTEYRQKYQATEFSKE